MSVVWELSGPKNDFYQRISGMMRLRKWIRSLFKSLVRLADSSPIAITDYETLGYQNVEFWHWIPDIPITVAKFMSSSGTHSEGASLFVYEHWKDGSDIATTACDIRAVDFSSVKVLWDDEIDWRIDLPESVCMVVLHEEEIARGSDAFCCGDSPPKIFYHGPMGWQLWRETIISSLVPTF